MHSLISGRTANLASGFYSQIKSTIRKMPNTAITLGSGLADMVENSEKFRILAELDKDQLSLIELPHFTASDHKLKILIVEEKITKEKIIVICGRKHLYEIDDDRDLKEVVRIPRALALAGVNNFFHTSAVGGIEPANPGKIISVTDHDGAELIPKGLFTGTSSLKFGPMFFDCSNLYKDIPKELCDKFGTTKGVLQWHLGRNYETPAQIQRLRNAGISGVGMSMLPESMALVQMRAGHPDFKNIKNIGIAIVSNPAAAKGGNINHKKVAAEMKKAGPNLINFIVEIIQSGTLKK